jgi:hypothetical protein
MCFARFIYIPLLTERINNNPKAINILLLWSKPRHPWKAIFVQSWLIRENLWLYSFFAMSFLLNIFNMRSVMTKPPTTFVVEQTTAMKPRIVLTVL